jgi:hypothetical protein
MAGVAISTSAFGATRSYLDLTAGVGASSNPSLSVDSESSAFGRLSGLGMHQWRSERTITSLSAYAENTTYLRGNGSTQIFDLRGDVVHTVSPTLSIFGNVGFQGDVNGQLSNRFTNSMPNFINPPPEQTGQPVQPLQPDPVILDDDTFIGLNGRRYRLSGEAGFSLRTSARGTVSLSAGAQRNFSGSGGNQSDFNSYFGTGSWQLQFSERTSGGASVNVQYQDYDNGLSSTVINPLVNVSHQFTDQIYGSAAVGLLFTKQEQLFGGSDSSIDPSFSFSLCKASERERFCGRLSRDARKTNGAVTGSESNTLMITTLLSADYSRQIDVNQSVQASLTGSRSSEKSSIGDNFRTTYLTFLAGYDRKVRQRVAVGATAGVRKLFRSGSDPKIDVNAAAYLRYRLGDIQ